ncbi:hypothetical protein R1sor_023802 [Riccia sorocarpa]|uniref:Myb/SANT-like DNA-binding domain-containing protein n=1 Tax=Riccia sorocarpa TaxID=122646 RepID=A0ABD3GSQ4_9MARC
MFSSSSLFTSADFMWIAAFVLVCAGFLWIVAVVIVQAVVTTAAGPSNSSRSIRDSFHLVYRAMSQPSSPVDYLGSSSQFPVEFGHNPDSSHAIVDSHSPTFARSASLHHYGLPQVRPSMVPPHLVFGTSLEGAVPFPFLPPNGLTAAALSRASVVNASTSQGGSHGAPVFQPVPSRDPSRVPPPNAVPSLSSPPGDTAQPTGPAPRTTPRWAERESLVLTQKWERVAKYLRARSVDAAPSQIRTKWNSLFSDFKNVRDFGKKSGHGNYFSMSKEERKEFQCPPYNLPLSFPKEWFLLIESFQGKKHTQEPLCVSESFDEPSPETGSDGTGVEAPSSATEAEDSPAEQHVEARSKSNSGVKKRKKSRADNVPFDNFQSSTDRLCSVEDKKLDFMRETEGKKVEVAIDQVASIREQTHGLCGALGQMAKSLDRIADSLHKR